MDETQPQTYQTLACMVDHLLLRPELSDDQIAEGCRVAGEYQVASVVVRPSDVDSAIRWMEGSGVKVASVVGYPDGSANTAAKLYEGRDLLRRGATELDMTINIGKMISRQFQYVEMELMQMAKSCAESGALLKVSIGTRYLAEDLKIIAAKILRRVDVPMITVDYDLHELALMAPQLKERLLMKADSGVDSLAQAMEVRESGCHRFGTTATAAILEDWKAELEQQAAGASGEG